MNDDRRAEQPDAGPLDAPSATSAGNTPRFGLFLFGSADAESISTILDRIPEAAASRLSEIVVMEEGLASRPGLPQVHETRDSKVPLLLHRPPRSRGHGAARKAAFEYARRVGLDHLITMRSDGEDSPERLPELIAASLEGPRDLVVVDEKPARRADGASVSALFAKALHGLSGALQRRVLGLTLRDFSSGYRCYSVEGLSRIPYPLNSNDVLFEVEVVIQFRALGARVRELSSDARRTEAVPAVDPAPPTPSLDAQSIASAFAYRLHQLHVIQDGRFLVERDVYYTFKRSETGSHMQIVDAIRAGSQALDLGCSQGLLAAPLREKGVALVGVDNESPTRRMDDLEAYYQRDLEQPLDLPVDRRFDYVIVADVIEHLRNRQQLLREARKFLKEDGKLIISTPNIAIWFYRLSLLAGRFEYGPRGVLDETHVRLYTGASFRREVERAGFVVVARRVTALPFEIVFEATGRSRLMRSLASFYHALARLWPSMFAYQHILEAEITTLDEESIR